MSFHAPVKELQPVDTSLPEYCIKGAVVLDPQLTEWNKRAIISSSTLPSTFLQINRQEQKIGEILKNAAKGLQLPENEQYGLIAEDPKRFIADSNLDSLTNGFMLTMSAAPDHYVRRINEILSQGNDIRKMEWAVAKLDEFSLDLALIEAFYKFSSLDLLFSLVRDDRVCMSSTLLSTCLRALSKMLELGVDSVGWQSVPRDVVVSVASMVTGKAKREEANALLFALQMIEQLVNSNSTTRDWVLEEVPIETLIRHVEKSDERIALSALSLMNSMIKRCINPEKRIEMIKSLEVVPFRNSVHSSLLRTGKPRDSEALEQLVQIQKQLISVYDLSEPLESDIQRILNIEQFDEEMGDEDEFRKQLENNRCGKLACRAILRIEESHQQDLKMMLSENTMRIEGGKWRFIPLCLRCVEIAAELFGIFPGSRNELPRLIPILFSAEHIFDEMVWIILQLFHRTWREMQAKHAELEKVANVVMEQLRFVLKMEQSHIEGLEESLERFTYRNLQEIWKDEQEERENDQLHSQSVIKLGEKLRPKMEEIVRINHRNFMKEGHVFRKAAKGKSAPKQSFWFWKLDSSEKFLTIRMCDEDGNSGQMEEIKQIWLKDIVDISNNDEIDRKTSSSKFATSAGIMIRGIRVELKTETLIALTNDEKIAAIWIDGLLELTGNPRKDARSQTNAMVERLLKMELRVRLLNVKSSDSSDLPEIPPFPQNFPFPSCA